MSNISQILVQISFPYIIIVSLVGIGGNFLTIIMLSAKSMSKSFNHCTLIALALTDLLFNFTLVTRCVNDFTQSNNEQLCRLLSFLSHLAEFLSACFTAQFTAQRFIAVRFPLSVFVEKKIHLVHYFIVALLITFGTVYCLALVKTNAYDFCHEELGLYWFISDALLSFFIPFTIIALLNILTVVYLKKRFRTNHQNHPSKRNEQVDLEQLNAKERHHSSDEDVFNQRCQPKICNDIKTAGPETDPLHNHSSDQPLFPHEHEHCNHLQRRSSPTRSKSQSYRITRMLIIVSTCFLLLNAPSHICTISLKIYTLKRAIVVNQTDEALTNISGVQKLMNDTLIIPLTNIDNGHVTRKTGNPNNVLNHFKWIELFYTVLIITQHVSYVSYSINFFLYSFCGMKFRHELLQWFSKQGQPTRQRRSEPL